MAVGVPLFALVLFTASAGWVAILYYHRIWNPVFLMLIIFFIASFISTGYKNQSHVADALVWVLFGEIAFVGAFFAAQMLINRSSTTDFSAEVNYNSRIVGKLINFNVILSLLSLLLNMYNVMKIAPSFSAIFIDSTYVRDLYLQRSSSAVVTILGILISINFYTTFPLFPIALRGKIKRSGLKLLLVLSMRLFTSLVTMSKMAFFVDLSIFVSAYILVVTDKKEEHRIYKKYGILFLMLIAVLLVVTSFQRNYIGQGRYSNYGEAVVETIRTYISAGIYGMGELLNTKSIHHTNGQLYFRPVFNILSYLGMGQRIGNFQTAIVGNINVYSAFGDMYRDFGYPGIIFLSALTGVFLGIIYNTNYKFKLKNIVINSMVCMTMLFTFYNFMLAQTVYFFVLIYAVFFDKITSSILYCADANDPAAIRMNHIKEYSERPNVLRRGTKEREI